MISTMTSCFFNAHFPNCLAVCIFQLATPWMTWFLSGRRMDQSKWLKASHCHSSSSKMNQTSDTAPSTTTQVTHAHKYTLPWASQPWLYTHMMKRLPRFISLVCGAEIKTRKNHLEKQTNLHPDWGSVFIKWDLTTDSRQTWLWCLRPGALCGGGDIEWFRSLREGWGL